MDFKEIMAREASFIEREIEGFFEREIENSLENKLTREVLHSLKKYTLNGGKRVRGTLVIMGYRAVGGEDLSRIRSASVGLELIQSMLLIHDDIIDRSPERRGRDSFHVKYSKIGSDKGVKGDPDRFGENIAIISGDLAEAFGEKALLESGFPSERVHRALRSQADMIRDTGFGQIMDIYSGELDKWTEEDSGPPPCSKEQYNKGFIILKCTSEYPCPECRTFDWSMVLYCVKTELKDYYKSQSAND